MQTQCIHCVCVCVFICLCVCVFVCNIKFFLCIIKYSYNFPFCLTVFSGTIILFINSNTVYPLLVCVCVSIFVCLYVKYIFLVYTQVWLLLPLLFNLANITVFSGTIILLVNAKTVYSICMCICVCMLVCSCICM